MYVHPVISFCCFVRNYFCCQNVVCFYLLIMDLNSAQRIVKIDIKSYRSKHIVKQNSRRFMKYGQFNWNYFPTILSSLTWVPPQDLYHETIGTPLEDPRNSQKNRCIYVLFSRLLYRKDCRFLEMLRIHRRQALPPTDKRNMRMRTTNQRRYGRNEAVYVYR